MRWFLTLLVAPVALAQDIGGYEYRRLETRAATRDAIIDQLYPASLDWGDWHLLSPFPFEGHGSDFAIAHPPESELPRMVANGPGPDLDRVWTGRDGGDVTWVPLGEITNRRIDLKVHEDESLNNNANAYLHGTVTVPEATSLTITMGSDDGMRLWLNGRLLVDNDVPRGLDPEAEKVRLDFEAGVNHLFVRVNQGAGGWDFQINGRPPIDPVIEAQLDYFLDRDFPPSEEASYYQAITIPVPDDIVLEVGGLAVLPDGRPIACTRRGDVWIIDNAYETPPVDATYTLFATGLHEPLGLAPRIEDGRLVVYAGQRAELTRLVDVDGDDVADRYETVCDDWGLSGNYHEFTFGPQFDEDGFAWLTLCLGFDGPVGFSTVPHRGWSVRIDPATGTLEPMAGGLRSPNGVGRWTDGRIMTVDNQGDWIGTCKLVVLEPGSYHGHPSSLRWWTPELAPGDVPERHPTAVWFPYGKMGQSTADVLTDDGAGDLGPWEGQIFAGDQTNALVSRVFLEVVDGVHQGACIPFRSGLDCGVNRLAWGSDGSMFVGQTDRGWGSVGDRRYGIQRIVRTDRTPFEILEMRIVPGGFDLEFTTDVDEATATDIASYAMQSYTYLHHATYGSPEVERDTHTITGVERLDARTVRLGLDRIRTGPEGFVHELRLEGLRAADGRALLHDRAYYTVQRLR